MKKQTSNDRPGLAVSPPSNAEINESLKRMADSQHEVIAEKSAEIVRLQAKLRRIEVASSYFRDQLHYLRELPPVRVIADLYKAVEKEVIS